MRESNEKGELQLASNVSTPLSVGGRPEGVLPKAQGRNSTALSAEILIIDLRCFRKAKQPHEKTTEPGVRAWDMGCLSSASLKQIVTDLFILTTGI